MMTGMACGNCVAWEKLPPSVLGPHATKGRCRLHPPDYSGRWPLTEPGDWCGEFKVVVGGREAS